ncbi:MAG: InlB B-repeat-containing protein [Oscillospiraceae bacterium]|nr:InlB B-repeat-containing protein [Oscillospiraceae bacterium]
MKVTKRCISLLLALTLILSVLPMGMFTATAQEIATDAVITVKNSYGKGGATVAVDVVIQNNPGILGMTLTLTYDESALTLTGVTNGDAMSALTFTAPKEFKSGVNLPWDAESISEEDIKDGVIATLTFEISKTAQLNSRVPVEVSYDAGAIVDNDLNSLSVLLSPGYIQVLDYTPGDLNDNGIVDTTDVVLLRRYIAGGYGVTIVENAADVNDDGKRNTTDAVLIRRYIAGGYGVELLPVSPKCDHTMEHTPYKAPTCTKEGNYAYWYCSTCKKYFNDEVGTKELTEEQLVIPLGDHTYSTEWSYDATYHWHGATCEHTDLVSDRAEHSFGSDKSCTVCGYSSAEDPTKPYTITYKLVEYNKHLGDTYLQTLNIDNSRNLTAFSATDSFDLEDPNCGEAYTFTGWYTENGVKVTRIAAGTTEDIILYARWKENTFDITYKLYQTPLGEITNEKYLHYTPSKGLVDLPNPELYNYIFLGWYTSDGEEVKEIPIGTTGDITLNAYWTSKRNQTKAVRELGDPIIMENVTDGVFYFAYEIGTIENVPLSDAIWTIQSVAGLAQQKSETVSTSISEERASEIAETISSATVDSATWTLSKDWNDVTEVDEEWAVTHGMTQEEANEITKTESGTYSFTSSDGGCDTTTSTDGTTTVDYKSQNYTHGNSAEFNAKIHSNFSVEAGVTADIPGFGGASAKTKVEVGSEIGGGYKQQKETNEHTGTDTTTVDTTVEEDTTTWNKSTTSSTTTAASESVAVTKALSDTISNTKGYGKSYSTGGENSESQEFSSTESKSSNTSSSLTYFSSETITTTTTYSTDGKSEGCYRLVIAGTVHVFAVVGYDVGTRSYFTYTINVLDEKTHEFLDYSPDLNFNDYENGAIPFEIPYAVHQYVESKIVITEGLTFKVNTANGTATVIGYSGDDKDVIIPAYISSGNEAYRVTNISADAFAAESVKTSLESVVIGEYIKEIPAGAFKNCTNLKEISGDFTIIGDEAFYGCENLDQMTLPASTTSIGTDAFKDVPLLKVMVLREEDAIAEAQEVYPEEAESVQKNYAAKYTQDIMNSAVNSGAHNVILDISEIMNVAGYSIEVPSIESFELVGDQARTYQDLQIKSSAEKTILRKLNIADCNRTPLVLSSNNLTMEVVSVESVGYTMLLSAENPSITLIRDSRLTASGGNAVVCRMPELISNVVDQAVGTLVVSGNMYVNGTEEEIAPLKSSAYLDVINGEIIPITNGLFEQYIEGSFKVTFDPNEGSVDETTRTVFCGAKLGSLPVPEREHYTFMGWYLEDGTTVTEDTVFSTGMDVTVYAKWTPVPYTVSWNTGAGYTISVSRTSSPNAGAATGALNNGDAVYYGDVLSISYSAATGYTLRSAGRTSVTVTGNVTSSEIFASATVASYMVSWNTGTGYTITVKRTSSPLQGASIGTLSSKETVYYGDVLSITYAAATGYSLTSKGSTSITVTGDVTPDMIFASAKVNSYTYKVVYRSKNGTDLGSATATYNYGTTNTIYPKSFPGYDTPPSQIVKWDSTSAKTITFVYTPSSVSASQNVASGWWWSAPSSGTGITYTATAEYRNRTSNSVEVRIVWTQSIIRAWYGYNQYFSVSFAQNGSETVKIASTSTWPKSGGTKSESVTVYSSWQTVYLSATETGVRVDADWWAEVSGESGSWTATIQVPAY